MNGVKYRFIDTAGLRETSEVVERMGIERSLACMSQASVVIVLLDSTAPVSEQEEVVSAVSGHLQEGTRVIWARSKADLTQPCAKQPVKGQDFEHHECKRDAVSPQPGIIDISAITGQGLDALKEAVASFDAEALQASGAVLVTNQRHYDALRRASEDLRRVLSGLDSDAPNDLVAEDLRSAASALGEIVGEILPDDVLGTVFSRFCIGK